MLFSLPPINLYTDAVFLPARHTYIYIYGLIDDRIHRRATSDEQLQAKPRSAARSTGSSAVEKWWELHDGRLKPRKREL